MPAPKIDTIKRFCDNGLAIEILHERGILTDEEAAEFFARSRAKSDEFYARLYGPEGA